MGDDSCNGRIALLHFGDPPLADSRRDVDGLGLRGSIMILIDVADLDQAHAALTEIGTRFSTGSPSRSTPSPRTAAPSTVAL